MISSEFAVPVIDLHSHILPGLDDGASSLADSLELARAAVHAGVTTVAGTPHVRHDFPTTPEAMEAALDQLRAALAAEGIPLDVRGGGELDLEWLAGAPIEQVRLFGLAGNPAFVLVEMPYAGWPLGIADALYRLELAGITPVLAHPERNPDVQERPERLRPLVEGGALTQVTAASLEGRFGAASAETALTLVRNGLAHLVASDVHRPERRGFELGTAAARAGGPELVDWLVRQVPGAILGGTRLPERPASGHRRRRGFWPLRR